MKWILIVTVLFSDGERYTGQLDAEKYTLDNCLSAAKDSPAIVDGRFTVLAASCVKIGEAI